MFACAAFVLYEGLFNNLTQFIMRYKKGNKWEKIKSSFAKLYKRWCES